MKIVLNKSKLPVDLYDNTGDSCTVQPGTSPVEDRFTVNLPPQVIIVKGE